MLSGDHMTSLGRDSYVGLGPRMVIERSMLPYVLVLNDVIRILLTGNV